MRILNKLKSWFSFRLTHFYLIHLLLLLLFGWMAMGGVGLLVAFWVVAAARFLPSGMWDNVFWLFGFLLVAASPLIDFISPTFRNG
jgi:hypothetical protein